MIGIGIGIPISSVLGTSIQSEPNPNLLLWSEQFDNAVWVKTLTTVTANQVNSPIGDLTADLLDPDASFRFLTQTSPETPVASSAYTFSVYVLAGPNHIGGSLQAMILEDGIAVGTGASIVVTSEWVRVSMTRTLSSSPTTIGVRLFPDFTHGTDIYAWGAKLEVGSSMTDYVKREGV